MPGVLLPTVREDHTVWSCPWPIDENIICSASNQMTETTCRNCGKVRWVGAEAISNTGMIIGELTGHDPVTTEEIWTYYY
ncbi:hypothetical protein G7Z17_g980 [Cylindrodendrum hubeiense]|uniref:Uncharacterized protein n=1 Tax=Cylindrodendrum hubeiense TaxID=595255 RepID=A0A9P5LFT9_9HYPO|nr:hypothetical protein G7Z17_g980 [Cylindrodendrum hubeiense]